MRVDLSDFQLVVNDRMWKKVRDRSVKGQGES